MAIKHRYTEQDYMDAATFRVKFKDYFHLKNLYIMMHQWLIENTYATLEMEDFPETFYLQRETQQAGREIWVWWRMEKDPPTHGSSYYKYVMDVDMKVILLRDVEVIHQGKKFKTNWGQPEIKIWARLVADYDHKWRKHWFLKNVNDVFHKRIFHHELEMHKIEFYREAYRFQEAIKTYLKLKTYLPEPELQKWTPARGIGETV